MYFNLQVLLSRSCLGPPTPPRNITTTPHCNCLTVAWEPPIDTGGFPISLYIQEVSFNGTVVTTANVGSSPRTYTFTRHLKPNTEYKLILFGKTVARKGESAEVLVKTSVCKYIYSIKMKQLKQSSKYMTQ